MGRYMPRNRKPPSQTWRTFLENHADCLASMDLFIVPTAAFRLLYGFVILRHNRRRIVHVGVTESPTAPRSPWQSPYVERVIGSIRREVLDHVIVLNEAHLRRILASYLDYYHGARTHLSLDKDTPDSRPVQPSDAGNIVAFVEIGGLHHRYERLAA